MSVRASLAQLLVRNWPIKLAAGFFAVMLYVAVAAQQPLAQSFAMRLAIVVPPGRSVRQQPAGVAVVITGKGSEILKLRSFPRVIRKVIPDTFSASAWHVQLQPTDIELPKGSDVQVADIRPRDIEVVLDSVVHKDVRIVPRVRVEAESGYVMRGLSITPSMARIIERSLSGVPITTAASGFAGFLLSVERVGVTVRGPESRVNTLTRDSVRVVAHLVGKAGPGGYARLTVSAPPGIVAHAVPDSVSLRRKTGRG